VAVVWVVWVCGFERSEKLQTQTTQTTDSQPNDMRISIVMFTYNFTNLTKHLQLLLKIYIFVGF